MLKSMLSNLIRSRRVGGAVVGNGMVSLASFALSISIARSSSISDFGAFSIALVSYLFTSGLIRATFTDTVLSRPDDTEKYARAFQRTSLVTLLGSVILTAWGLISENCFLVVLGVSLHGLLSLDFIRTFDSAAASVSRALATTTIWSILSLTVSISSLFIAIDPWIVFAAWSAGGAMLGYISAFKVGVSLVPKWRKDDTDTRIAVVFAADYLIGAGGTHLTTGLLGFVNDVRVLSAVRGAGTLLGPMNLISTTARSFMLPFLSRNVKAPDRQLQSAVLATTVQVILLAPLLIILQFIPDSVGVLLLGDTWQLAGLALLPLSIESLFALVAAVAISGHRVAFAGVRTILLRLTTGLSRPVVVLFCAHTWGVSGAAWAMAVFAITSAVIWWVSYYNLSRRSSRSTNVN